MAKESEVSMTNGIGVIAFREITPREMAFLRAKSVDFLYGITTVTQNASFNGMRPASWRQVSGGYMTRQERLEKSMSYNSLWGVAKGDVVLITGNSIPAATIDKIKAAGKNRYTFARLRYDSATNEVSITQL